MGTRHVSFIAEKLQEHGMDSTMPVSIIQSGTTASQKTVTGTLQTIADDMERAKIAPPALIIIGSVNDLRNELDWLANDAENTMQNHEVLI